MTITIEYIRKNYGVHINSTYPNRKLTTKDIQFIVKSLENYLLIYREEMSQYGR